jgi:3-oxoacyl-[acyl-carrier protein] reductase
MKKYTVVITGAAGNIGSEVAKFFRAINFDLILIDKVYKKIKIHNASFFEIDMTDLTGLEKIIDNIKFEDNFININCIGFTKDALLPRVSEDDFMRIFDINVKAVFFLMKKITEKSKEGGHIINLSSISGLQGREGQSAYSAAKGALVSMTKSFAKETAEQNVRANIVLPGFIPSDITGKLSEKKIQEIKNSHLLKKFQNKSETARFIYNLALMENVTAQVFNIDSRITV